MSLTRGPQGISGIPKISAFGFVCSKPIHKYYVALILLVITVLFIKAIMNSRMGRAISAIRDDETAADAMGINVFKMCIRDRSKDYCDDNMEQKNILFYYVLRNFNKGCPEYDS